MNQILIENTIEQTAENQDTREIKIRENFKHSLYGKKKLTSLSQLVIAIKGAGEMASGIACRLFQCNFKKIFMMETCNPMAVRRKVCFSEAVYDSRAVVEGIEAVKVFKPQEIQTAWAGSKIPVIVDPDWNSLNFIRPHIVIDAIIAKKNLGTNLFEAPLVIGLGPGFEAKIDVHMAIETNRGHNLGRVMDKGSPEPNTGTPGNINGYTKERVLRAPCSGQFFSVQDLGAMIKKNDLIGHVDKTPVTATIDGVLRGLIRDKTRVAAQVKIGDIDPRKKVEHCYSVSEKARAIGGSVLEAILREYNK